MFVEERLLKDKESTELTQIIHKLPEAVRSELYYQLFLKYFASAPWMAALKSDLYNFLIGITAERVVLPE